MAQALVCPTVGIPESWPALNASRDAPEAPDAAAVNCATALPTLSKLSWRGSDRPLAVSCDASTGSMQLFAHSAEVTAVETKRPKSAPNLTRLLTAPIATATKLHTPLPMSASFSHPSTSTRHSNVRLIASPTKEYLPTTPSSFIEPNATSTPLSSHVSSAESTAVDTHNPLPTSPSLAGLMSETQQLPFGFSLQFRKLPMPDPTEQFSPRDDNEEPPPSPSCTPSPPHRARSARNDSATSLHSMGSPWASPRSTSTSSEPTSTQSEPPFTSALHRPPRKRVTFSGIPELNSYHDTEDRPRPRSKPRRRSHRFRAPHPADIPVDTRDQSHRSRTSRPPSRDTSPLEYHSFHSPSRPSLRTPSPQPYPGQPASLSTWTPNNRTPRPSSPSNHAFRPRRSCSPASSTASNPSTSPAPPRLSKPPSTSFQPSSTPSSSTTPSPSRPPLPRFPTADATPCVLANTQVFRPAPPTNSKFKTPARQVPQQWPSTGSRHWQPDRKVPSSTPTTSAPKLSPKLAPTLAAAPTPSAGEAAPVQRAAVVEFACRPVGQVAGGGAAPAAMVAAQATAAPNVQQEQEAKKQQGSGEAQQGRAPGCFLGLFFCHRPQPDAVRY